MTDVVETTNSKDKEISNELQEKIETFADRYSSSKELLAEIVTLAERQNISKQELRERIEDALERRGLKDRQIRNLLPPDLKREYAIQKNSEHSAVIAESKQDSEESTIHDEQEEEKQEEEPTEEDVVEEEAPLSITWIEIDLQATWMKMNAAQKVGRLKVYGAYDGKSIKQIEYKIPK